MIRKVQRAQIPLPPESTRISFPLDAVIDVEIGCGVGMHPIRYARENPERTLIAIEHTREKFEKFQRRIEHHPPMSNLIPLHANAISWVAHALPAARASRVIFLYPNPYLKASQAHRRWHRLPSMELFIEGLLPGGELWLATNIEEYAQEAVQFLTQEWGLRLVQQRELRLDQQPDYKPRTHFEKKYLLSGQVCFDLKFSKSS